MDHISQGSHIYHILKWDIGNHRDMNEDIVKYSGRNHKSPSLFCNIPLHSRVLLQIIYIPSQIHPGRSDNQDTQNPQTAGQNIGQKHAMRPQQLAMAAPSSHGNLGMELS